MKKMGVCIWLILWGVTGNFEYYCHVEEQRAYESENKIWGLACYMIEKEKQDICKNELYEACSKLQCELGTYADYLSNLLMLVEESFIRLKIFRHWKNLLWLDIL